MPDTHQPLSGYKLAQVEPGKPGKFFGVRKQMYDPIKFLRVDFSFVSY